MNRDLSIVSRRYLELLVIAASSLGLVACDNPEQPLLVESRLSGPIHPGESDVYTIDLEVGQLLHLDVEQKGVDVAVTILDPEGSSLAVVDGLLGAVGTERVLWLAARPGPYRVEILGTPQVDESRYEIWLEEPRTASPRDQQMAAAAKTYYEAGSRLAEQDYEFATREYTSSLEQWDAIGDDDWSAEIHFALGYVSNVEKDFEKALHHYRRALETAASEAVKVKSRHNIARIHLDRDELEMARDEYKEALAGWQNSADRLNEARAANDLGFVYKYLRQVSEALDYYDRALTVLRDLDRPDLVALTLHNRGRAYTSQGKAERALEDLRESLAIYEALEDSGLMAAVLNGIGHALRDLGELQQAKEHFERALALQPSERDRAAALVGIGEIHYRRGEPDKAEDLYGEALRVFRELGERRDESYVLRNLGLIEDSLNPGRAAALYGEALAIARDVNDRDQEAACLLGLARVERNRSNPLGAKGHIEAALALVEELRQQGAVGADMRSTFFARKQNYYDFYVDLLMELAIEEPDSDTDYAALALSASERARARSQLESLIAAGSEPGSDRDPLTKHQESLRLRIEEKQFQLTKLLFDGTSDGRVAVLKRELRAALEDLDELRGEIRDRMPLYAQVTDPQPLSAVEIQRQVLDEDTLLLEYQLGEQRSFVWAATSDSLSSYVLPGQADIEKLARAASKLLDMGDQTVYQPDIQRVLTELSALLLEPVERHLDKPRILVVGEGALQYIPFAVLPSPIAAADGAVEPLVAGHEIVSLPSASLLKALRDEFRDRQEPSRDVAVFADPIFKPASLTTGPAQVARLRDSEGQEPPKRLLYSALEAQAILRLATGRSNLQALRARATKEAVRSRSLREYRYLHIATHGFLDSEFPELSSLVFSLYDSQDRPLDGRLRVHEVYQLDLLADLVVLSACRTAHGRDVSGEGIVGWTQGFMYSGAKRVLVSLWNVDDEATAELMGVFYEYMLVDRLSPAAALRRAQNAIRRVPRWQEPYYWAGLVLQGEYL